MKFKNMIIALLCFLIVTVGCSNTKEIAENDVNAEESKEFFSGAPRLEDDFYETVNFHDLKEMKIPADKTSWGTFNKISNETDNQMKTIFSELSRLESEDEDIMKAVAYYNMAMDMETRNSLGIEPLEVEFDFIDNNGLNEIMLHFIFETPVGALMDIGAYSDMENSSLLIFDIYQPSLGLPSRRYYFEEEEILESYKQHLVKIFEMIGDDNPEESMQKVLRVETFLAEYSNTPTENRDIEATTNKFTIQELKTEYPNLPWGQIFEKIPADDFPVNVGQLKYFEALNKYVVDTPIEDMRPFFKYALINAYINYLSDDFVLQNFEFYGKTLRGQEEQEPLWKRSQDLVLRDFPHSIGKVYVQKYFSEESKEEMEKLVSNLKIAFEARIKDLDWMTPETKTKALEKLEAMGMKIGYPDKWDSYENIEVLDNEFLKSRINIVRFEALNGDHGLFKVGQAKDKTKWSMPPFMVNAYYSGTNVEIVFPAAILQEPFFSLDQTDAQNYAGIGMVIGHEITHGFDDKGKKMDKNGNLNNWWTDDDEKAFEVKSKMMQERFDSFEVLPEKFINGNLTLGENIADLGGLNIALDAYHLVGNNDEEFFTHYSKSWVIKMREERQIQLLNIDPHSPAKYRVNGILPNLDSFYTTFNITESDGMFIPNNERIKIW